MEKVYYFPFGAGAADRLEIGYRNYRDLFSSELRPLVEYDLTSCEACDWTYYVSDRLDVVPENQLDSKSKAIIETLRRKKSNTDERDCLFLFGTQTINGVLEPDIRDFWHMRLRELMLECDGRCASHGDLTPFNIMLRNGKPVVIDLDRFSFHGFYCFDEVHYKVERHVKRRRTDWLRFISALVEGESAGLLCSGETASTFDANAVDLYFLIRLTHEYRLGENMPIRWVNAVNKFAQLRASCRADDDIVRS